MPHLAKLRRDSRQIALVPVVLGMLGVFFATQLQDTLLQITVILLCLAVPLFVSGNLLARYRMDLLQRIALLAGMAMLMVGAIAGIMGYSTSLGELELVPTAVMEQSSALGLASLLLGLVVVLISLIRSQALASELSERFRHLAEHMVDGFVLTGYDGCIVMVNPSLLKMTGLTEDQLVGRKSVEVAREMGIETMAQHKESRARGVASDYEVSWKLKGTDFHFLVSGTPIYDQRGRRVGALAIVRDITKQHQLSKRLEDYTERLEELVEDRTSKLRASETRHTSLLQDMDEGFLITDQDCLIQYANARASSLLVMSNKELLARNVLDLVVSDQRHRLKETILGAHDDASHQEYAFTRADGNTVPVKVAMSPTLDENNVPYGFSLVITDVTELKHMQHQIELRARQLEQANEELRRLDHAKDVFLSNVSHELRTPLSTLQGYVEMLQAGTLGEVQAPQIGAFNVMERNADRLSRLINEMIEFSRMEIKGVRLYKTLFAPSHLVEESISSAAPQALNKEINLVANIEPDLPAMWGDRGKLGQVLGILLSNAIKFSGEHSTVEVQLRRNQDGGVDISVVDNGIGIELKNHEKIFAKFYQVDDSMTRNYQGTGIGLSIAKSIVEAHEGSVVLKSERGKGSTFTTQLPDVLFDNTHVRGEELPPLDLHVYIVNQHPEFREAIVKMLSEFRCTVEEFRSGHDCIRAAREEQPDVILVDETLPDLSGAEAVALLKEELVTNEIPTVLMRSTDSNDSLKEESLLHGVSLLDKPFTPGQLWQVVYDNYSNQAATTAEELEPISIQQSNEDQERS